MHARAKLGAGRVLATAVVLMAGSAFAQVRLDTTGTTTGNPYYKMEEASPSNTGLAKLICATPYGGKGADSITSVRVLRDRTILVAGNRTPDSSGTGTHRGWGAFLSSADKEKGVGFLMRLDVKNDATVSHRNRVDLPGKLNRLKLDPSGRICVLLDKAAVYMIEPGAPEPLKHCVAEGIRDFAVDTNGELVVVTKDEIIRYGAFWRKVMWKQKIPCRGANQGAYVAVDGRTGVAIVLGTSSANNGRDNWLGPYAHGFDREGKKLWTLWMLDPKQQGDGRNALTADTWGRAVRVGSDGKVYMELMTVNDRTVLTRDPVDASKTLDSSVFDGAFEKSPGKGYRTYGEPGASVLFRVNSLTGKIEHGTWMNAWLTDSHSKANPLYMLNVASDRLGHICVVGSSQYGCPVKDPWYYDPDKFRGQGYLAIFDENLQMVQSGYFHQTMISAVDAAYGYVVIGGRTLTGSKEQSMNLKAHNPLQPQLTDPESECYLAVFSVGDHGQPEPLGPLAGGSGSSGTTVTPPIVAKVATPAEQAALQLQIARDLIDANKNADAKAKLEYIMARYASTPSAGQAKQMLAKLAEAEKTAAAVRNPQASGASPEDEKAADRLYQQAKNYLANGMKDLAKRKLKEAVKKYPKTVAAQKADRLLITEFGM